MYLHINTYVNICSSENCSLDLYINTTGNFGTIGNNFTKYLKGFVTRVAPLCFHLKDQNCHQNYQAAFGRCEH